MKIKFYITIILTVTFFTVNAQSDYYYYYKGQKIYLNLDKKKVFLTTNTGFQESTIQENLGVENVQLETDLNIKRGELEYYTERECKLNSV